MSRELARQSSITHPFKSCADELSCVAQAFKTRADELSPITRAGKTYVNLSLIHI